MIKLIREQKPPFQKDRGTEQRRWENRDKEKLEDTALMQSEMVQWCRLKATPEAALEPLEHQKV